MLVQCVSVEPPLGLGKGWSSPPSQVQPGWRRGGGGGGGGGRCSARVETDSDPARLAAAPLAQLRLHCLAFNIQTSASTSYFLYSIFYIFTTQF